MRKMIALPGSKVYHERSCWHLKHSKQANWIYFKPEKAEKKGYRPCKCCSTARFHLTYERKVLNRFIEGKGMEYKILGDAMYVKTEISCWKILYTPKDMTYRIYHRNKSERPVDFLHPELERYHFQQDKRDATTMAECFQYIRSHDSFRKSEQEAGGNLKIVNISPKYRRQFVNRKRREARHRLDSIFAALEQKNPEYAALSCC